MINETKKGFSTAEATGGKRFTITDDALIMQRLSDDIYQNPIAAVIRELTTNAIDAQKDNGSTKKVEVHLPKIGAEYFSVTDSGLGMSKDLLLNVYTSYGSSNRRNSNDHIGGIGVGSKSPFAYCSQFTVRSVHNGKLVEAVCQKDQQGVPNLYITREEDTTESSGTSVKISVGRQDHPRFEADAKEVLYWFRDQVSVNVKLENWLYVDHLFENENGIVSGQVVGPRVLMGNILYNISHTHFNEYFQRYSILKMPIGSLGINISRESIQDNEANNSVIKKAFDQFYSEAKASILKKIEAIKCPLDKYQEARANSGVFRLQREVEDLNLVSYDSSHFQVFENPEEYFQQIQSKNVRITDLISEGAVYHDLTVGFKSVLKRFGKKCVITGNIKKFREQFAFMDSRITVLSEAKKEFSKSSGSKCFYKYDKDRKRFVTTSGMTLEEVKKEVASNKTGGNVSVIVPLRYKSVSNFTLFGRDFSQRWLEEIPSNVCLYAATNAVSNTALQKIQDLLSLDSYLRVHYANHTQVKDLIYAKLLKNISIRINDAVNEKIGSFDYYQNHQKDIYKTRVLGKDLIDQIRSLHEELMKLNRNTAGYIVEAVFQELSRSGSLPSPEHVSYQKYVELEEIVEKKMQHPFFEIAFPKIDDSYYEKCWQKGEEILNAQVSK